MGNNVTDLFLNIGNTVWFHWTEKKICKYENLQNMLWKYYFPKPFLCLKVLVWVWHAHYMIII